MKKQIGIAAVMVAVGAAAGVVASHANAQLVTPTLSTTAPPLVKDANGVVLGRLAGISYTPPGMDERQGKVVVLTSAGYLVGFQANGGAPVAAASTILYSATNCTGTTYVAEQGSHLVHGVGKVAVYNTSTGKFMVAVANTSNVGPQSVKQGACSLLSGQTMITAPYFQIIQPSQTELGLPATIAYPLRVE